MATSPGLSRWIVLLESLNLWSDLYDTRIYSYQGSTNVSGTLCSVELEFLTDLLLAL